MIKKRFFKVNKLVREKISESFFGCIQKRRFLDKDEYLIELRKKILEEANEILESKNNQELISELADLFEVLKCFLEASDIKKEQIDFKIQEKLLERGSFEKMIFCEYVEVPSNSKCLSYFLENSKKYPEILNLKKF